MRVIITGGSGLIGTALGAELAQAGYEVISLSRTPERQAAQAGVQAVAWDSRTHHGWGHLADGAAAIVNLAGESLADGRWTPERKQRILNSRVYAGQAVSEAVRAAGHKPGVVLQASAVGFYGLDPQRVYQEGDPAGDGFESQVCQAWEAASQDVDALGVRRVIMRIAVALSPDGGALPRMLLPFKLFAGGPLGSGRQPMSWIHLYDLVQAMRFLIETPQAQGVYNLAAPHTLTNAEFSRLVGRVMRRPAFVPAPAFAIRLLFGEMATVVLDGRRVSADKLIAAGFNFRYPQAEAALQQLLKES